MSSKGRCARSGTGAPAVAPAQGSRSRPELSKQGVATPVDGARMRTNVQLTANTAIRWLAPANEWSFSTRGRGDRHRGAAPAKSAAVAAKAARVRNRNSVIAHWVVEAPNKDSFIRALASAGAHLIVVTFAFDGKAGQMVQFLKEVLDDESLQARKPYVSCSDYESDRAFVYRS